MDTGLMANLGLAMNDRSRLMVLVMVLAVFLGMGDAVLIAQDAVVPKEGEKKELTEEEKEAQELAGLVTGYFKATGRRDRSGLLSKIKGLKSASVKTVAEAIGKVQLWDAQEAGLQKISIESSRDGRGKTHTTDVHVLVPEKYDSKKAYPLVVALHGQDGSGEQFVRVAAKLLGKQANEFIVAAPADYEGVWLGSPQDATDDPTAILRALRRKYHIDTDRVYLLGYSLGGHASCSLSTFYGENFAGAVCLAGTFVYQVGQEAVDMLLPNTRHVPMLIVYGENDSGNEAESGIAEWNRYVGRVADRLKLPIEMVELAGKGHSGILPPEKPFEEMLKKVRVHDNKTVQHWFRYPSQGRAYWLRQGRFLGEPWTAQQLVVSPAPGEDVSAVISELLKDRLAYLGGKIEGQTVRVDFARSSKVDLLLNDELIDLDKDIEVYVDGTIRFEGRAIPRIDTMLEMAVEDWEFQKLWPVRLKLSLKGRAVQD